LLLRMEPPHRSALAHHVHRTAPMGAWVSISQSWYYGSFLLPRNAGYRLPAQMVNYIEISVVVRFDGAVAGIPTPAAGENASLSRL
jgi:hypothetical protein